MDCFADRYGRRLPIAINFALFAVVEISTGLAQTFTQFLVIRALLGVVRGGQWGIGVTLAMEQVPARLRGMMSGILQEGYAIGYLLAAAAFYLFFDRFPRFSLSSLFWSTFANLLCGKKLKSEDWGTLGRSLVYQWKLFLYFVLLMMALHMSSHGTQDIYPTFLQRVWHMPPRERTWVSSLAIRGSLPGHGNQFGVLLASGIVYIELALANGSHYARAMASTTFVVFLLAASWCC